MTFDLIDSETWPFDPNLTFYLAGPMSGYPEYNFDQFEMYARVLRDSGLKIASPHEIDHGETPETRGSLPYQTYIDAGIKLLESCGGIILISGWPQSSGACHELSRAIDLGMPVYYVTSDPLFSDASVMLISMNRRPPA